MDTAERRKRLDALSACVQSDPRMPWWVLDLIRILDDVIQDVDDLGEGIDKVEISLVSHQKSLDSLSHRYSELLYKLSSAE
jgi:hypothetical protein